LLLGRRGFISRGYLLVQRMLKQLKVTRKNEIRRCAITILGRATMNMDYAKYIEDVTEDIKTCIGDMACQPILFVGSGFTKRYLNGPNWEELLKDLAARCPEIRQFAYYKQRYPDFVDIGTQFSEKYNDWAWGDGQDQFPKELYDEASSPQIYIKHTVAEIFKDLLASGEHKLAEEIELLKKIRPHSVITTNYDQLLEGFLG
jgi:hypothetical protein